MSVILLKIATFFITLGSSLVYNFHKRISGVKTKKNIKYNKNGGLYNKLDIHYPANTVIEQDNKISKNKSKNFNTLSLKNGDIESLDVSVSSKENKEKPCIVYFHGGGWTAYSKSIYTTLTRRLAKMGYVVFNVNYGLAPKNKMDGIIDDSITAINWVIENAEKYGGDPSKIILAGDSAGAHISSLIAGYTNNNIGNTKALKNKIKALILLYGVYDLNTMLESRFPRIKVYAKACLRGGAYDKEENYKFSPVNYITEDFPPCFLASGEIDKLHKGQSKVFKENLLSKNIYVETKFFRKDELRAVHAYMIFDGLYTNTVTLKSIEKFLKEVL